MWTDSLEVGERFFMKEAKYLEEQRRARSNRERKGGKDHERKLQQLPDEAQRKRQPRWPRWRRESKRRKHFNERK